MTSKKYYFFWFLSMFVFLGTCTYVFWPLRLNSQKAEELATAQLRRFAKSDGFDIRLLNGPEPTTPPVNVPYMFEWAYRDKTGEIKLYVWVAKDGYTKVIWEGDIDRLRTLAK